MRNITIPVFKIISTAIVGIACLVMICPLFFYPKNTGPLLNGDWDQLYFHQAAARQSVLKGHGFAFWCPYVNGGFPLTAHPHDPSFSPLFPVTLVFGEVLAPRINVALIFLGGIMGMALFTGRCLKYSAWGVFASTLVYTVAGWLPGRLFGGNYWETFFYLFPLALFCLHKAKNDRRFLFLAAGILYLLLCETNFTYVVCILFLGLICLSGRYFAKEHDSPSSAALLWLLFLAVLFSAAVGAVKIHLLGGLLSIDPRPVEYLAQRARIPMNYFQFLSPEGLCAFWKEFFRIKIIPEALVRSGPGMLPYLRPQYIGCGFIPVVLGLAATIKSPKKFGAVFLLLTLAVLLTIGRYMTIDIFYPLTFVPIFRSILDTTKTFNYFMLFFICILCGGFFHMASQPKPGPWKNTMLAVLLLGATALPLSQHCRIFPNTFVEQPPSSRPASNFFQMDHGYLYENLKQKAGVINWYTTLSLPTRVAPKLVFDSVFNKYEPSKTYKGETWLKNGNGQASLLSIGFNQVYVFARLKGPDTIVINQNHAPGWRTNTGTVKNHNGLLAVELPGAGSYQVRLRFRPPGIGLYMGFALVCLLCIIIYCWQAIFRKHLQNGLYRLRQDKRRTGPR